MTITGKAKVVIMFCYVSNFSSNLKFLTILNHLLENPVENNTGNIRINAQHTTDNKNADRQ